MTLPSYDLRAGLVIWAVVIAALVLVSWKRRAMGVGLVFAYLFNLWLIHWPATALYLLPWHSYYDVGIVKAGFDQSVYGVLALGIGIVVLGPILRHLARGRRAETLNSTQPSSATMDPQLPKVYMFIGLISYLFVFPIAGRIPSFTALVSTANQLMLVGLCLACWQAWQANNRRAFQGWLALALGLPFLTLVLQGFLGYGVTAFAIVFMFVANFYRPRWKLVMAGLLLSYLGLSLYVTYMRDRNEIRHVVWGNQSIEHRIEQVADTLSTFEWLDLHNRRHLHAIDGRLNQSFLVGAAVHYLALGLQDYARGETLWQATVAVIPRALWPDKPVYAGSGDLVTMYTGIPFASSTSVGVGQVLEFYINFGTVGVIVGFLILGVVIAMIDAAAARHLQQGDWQHFVLWYLPGLGLLQAGGSLVEVTATTSAGLLTAYLVNRFVVPFLRGRQIILPHPRRDRLPVRETPRHLVLQRHFGEMDQEQHADLS